MANQVNKDAIVRFLAGYESDLAAVKVENGTVYFALKPDPLNASNTIGSIYLDADGKRIMMSGESLAVRDELGDRILTKYIKGIDFGANTGEQGKISYVKGDNSSVDVNVPSASASAAGFVTTGAQTFAGTKTFNSPLIPLGGSYVHSAIGTSGTSGYVKIATFKISGTYQNMPIVIELVDRVRKGSCVLNIQFQNVNSNDPTLATFTFEGVDYNCHLYKSATSTWDLYVQKGEAHGQPTVVRFHKSPYMSKVAVTWTNAHADTIPSGAQKAVLGGNVANASKADSATKATQDGSGNNIQTTYLRDLDSESSTSGFKFWGVKGNSSTATEITIPDASTTIAGLVNTTAQTFAGRKTFNGGVEFNVKDFDYSAIEQGTSDAYRVVWFADSAKKGKPVYDSGFTYNPSSKTLKASNFDGLAAKSTSDGQGNNIYTTYLSDLTSTNNASIFTIQGIKKNGGNSPTTITINGATTEKAGLMTAEEQSFAGEKEFTDTTTFSGASGFEYSGIESATSNSARVVWFAHASKKGTPVYHNDFTYNPGTKTLTVGKITGTITKATGDGQGNEIYSTYLSDVASSNDGTTFNIWGLTKKGGDSPTTVTIKGATTEKAGLVTTGAQTWAGAKTFNNDITISGANTNIQKEGSSTSWIYGRNTALIKLTSYKGYNAITSMKTTNGDWSYGVYSDDISYWTYTPDTQYDTQDNKGYVQMKLTPAGKLITVDSETGHLFAKSVAIGSDNTNYKLYNSGTTYLADALTVAARATVDTLKISKTEAAKHIEFARGGFNYIATAANGCIAFLPNGASTGEDTSRLIVEDGGARPGATNTYNLGTSGKRWKNIYGNALNISGASTLTGAVTLGGNLSVGGTLRVTGATTLSSTLTVTGKTVLSSVVEIGNDLTVTGAILGKDKLTIGQADLNTDYTVYVNGASYFKGNVTSNGTLHLTKTTDSAATADNNVALIIGPRDGTHLIADNNEIMVKSNGTAAGPLYLNNDGGQVVVGAGGFTTSGYSDTTGGNGFRIRRSDVTYGRFYAITAGTTSVTGIGQLTLGNSTSTGTTNNAAGVLRLYGLGDKYTDIRTVQGSGNHAYYFSNHGQTGYSIARGAVQAYGGLTTPVWINASGNVVAFVDTIGSTAKPVYMKDGAITEITPADMFSVLKWNAGTTAGPTLDMTIGTYRRTATIPTATQTNSGVVIAGTQTFGGAKTFTDSVTVNGATTLKSAVKIENDLTVDGTIFGNDNISLNHASNPYVQFKINSTVIGYVQASGKKMAIGPSFNSSIRIDENGKIFTPANVGIGGEPQDAYTLYNHGTTYFAGKTTIANDLLLHGNILYANGSYTDLPVIRFVTGSNDGTGVVIGGGGIAIFGSGESANNLYTNLGTTVNGATETTYITGDGDIVFYSNCQTIGSRVGAKFTTARAFVPEVSQLGSIGTSSLEWGAIYAVNETLSGTLTVNGASTLKGAVTMNSTLLVSGESTFRNNVTIGPKGYAEKHISMYIDRKKTGGGGWAWNQISLRGSDGVDFAHYGVLGNADALTYIFIGTKAYNEDNFRIYADGSIWAVNGTLKGSLSVGTTSTFTGVATFKSPVTMENELTINGLITSKGNIHITNSNPNIKFTDTGKNNQVYYVQGYNGNLYFGPGSANSPYVDSTGVLHTIANKYTDNYTDAGLNLHNSDIVGVNSIYTADASESSQEGIHFYRDATHVDTIWVAKGVMYFTPNRTIGSAGTSYYIARTATENGNVGSTNTLTYVEGGVIKATTANIGDVRRPLFMSSGQLTTCDAPASGAWFTGVPSIGADGVMEIGRYIDFHSTNTTAKDYSVRIDAGTGDAANTLYLPDITGQVVVHTNNTQIGSGVKPVYVATSGAVTASSSTLGGTAKPIWMNAGELKACSATVGATDKPVFMSAGEIKPSTSSLGNNTKFIYMSSGQIKASTATVGGDTRPVYLSAGTVTPISYTAIAYGGTGATTRGQAINNLLYVGNNPITSTTNDTTANWAKYSNTVSFYTTSGYLVSQPQQYGLVLTIGSGDNTQELHQIWSSQPHGDLWHRGGNGSSWGGTWRKILDTSNYTSTMDGRYVNVSGDTMTGMLRVNNAPIFGYRYGASNNAPAFVFDKPSSNYTGIGANGTDDTIYFGAVSSDGNYNWVTDYKQKWQFNGTVTADQFNGPSTEVKANQSAPAYNQTLTYFSGQIPLGTAAGNAYAGSSNNRNLWSFPAGNGDENGSVANVQVLRMSWGTTYWQEIFCNPNRFQLWYRAVRSGTADAWKRIWIEGNSVTGAVWNDYAECREADTTEYGYVLTETGKDSLTKTTERLQHFAGVSSDTWGFSQGETEKAKTPIAVAGRVLVYPYQDRNNYQPGDCVCAAPGGTVDIMTREEVVMYPDRIVGTVSHVPEYDTWGGGEMADRDPVKVNGRIWIKVR